MPTIYDNLTKETQLLTELQSTLKESHRADFCVGYFNLRGWSKLDELVDGWAGGDGACARILVGMQTLPDDDLRRAFSAFKRQQEIDQATVARLKRRLVEDFAIQLTVGAPTTRDEIALRRLRAQLEARKVVVKLHLRHPLHAKLYLLYRDDRKAGTVGYLGSSNLTFAGLSGQGELNVDVLENDAAVKLEKWFKDRWADDWSEEINAELIQIIDESWAREKPIPPYHIYLKMAYHLSQEARAGLDEFKIPADFGKRLFEYQTAAVKIAANHLNKRKGVLIGDVVGLGKTLMATAIARIFQDDVGMKTLIICPKNLVGMWKEYVRKYNLLAEVVSLSMVMKVLPTLPRFRIVLIDESHNLRNREGKRYHAIQEYIKENDSKCIMLTATPYNKQYLDLSSQLRLFVDPEANLGIRPEQLLAKIGEIEFSRQSTYPVNSLGGFEKSEEIDDWRELMRLFMVRRTRSFIQRNYATFDPKKQRYYLMRDDNTPAYFPAREPQTVKFKVGDPGTDQYARMYHEDVVDIIDGLALPRYGLSLYIDAAAEKKANKAEATILNGLSRAGTRLIGFTRINLFKRLESSGSAFIQSVERHILRNYVYLYAIENGLDLPIGTQNAALLDFDTDQDTDEMLFNEEQGEQEDNGISEADPAAATGDLPAPNAARSKDVYRQRAEEVYKKYVARFKTQFKWLRPSLFRKELEQRLASDAQDLLGVLHRCGDWQPGSDEKLAELVNLLDTTHANDKVIVFTQFADTAEYLARHLKARGVTQMECVTGNTEEPTAYVWRFSPHSNDVYIKGSGPLPNRDDGYKPPQINPEDQLRVLVATDVLSEGQNLQDCAIVVNYDLPWTIIRLIQRAGRVDRIGQQADTIICYSFLPAEGVERIIRLRAKVSHRLKQNAEVVGTDEVFFDDEQGREIRDLYNERTGILDSDTEDEVDLASYAYQIWKNASADDQRAVQKLPPVVYSTREYSGTNREPPGVLVYTRTADGTDALAWIAADGSTVTQSQFAIIRAAECAPNTPPIERAPNHHELVQIGVEQIADEVRSSSGQLGRPSGAQFRVYERLKEHARQVKGRLWDTPALHKAIDAIYQYKLRQPAIDKLNRQLRSGIDNYDLADMVINLYEHDELSVVSEDEEQIEPEIVCSLGLRHPDN